MKTNEENAKYGKETNNKRTNTRDTREATHV